MDGKLRNWWAVYGIAVVAAVISAVMTDRLLLGYAIAATVAAIGSLIASYADHIERQRTLDEELTGANRLRDDVKRVAPTVIFNAQTGTLCDSQGAKLPDGIVDTALAKLREHT